MTRPSVSCRTARRQLSAFLLGTCLPLVTAISTTSSRKSDVAEIPEKASSTATHPHKYRPGRVVPRSSSSAIMGACLPNDHESDAGLASSMVNFT
ncbi:hypothetical protein PF005_g32302 [Phytophthora fragariae]|uniref:RxLR effector protein n=1 Tax=Phytophthora fragariae TaxID=53985 RepID=A0A6A3VA15_9STRA|nr:hypothetical protein PF003_g36424 [Phytophthora fragariae]KAE8917437.1 hypothetical protein PF009_g32242 [Phytophthora fragariae]KAE8955878.1 hypothetical protein PF011_g31662 [Phytophthora fragariae]KAE9056941.1 hypothetical protein PF007_g31818 [Phytophthora fragariae]KAE9058398.1 hypothetical protein PF006_g32154 [Phytophthora fragariae]